MNILREIFNKSGDKPVVSTPHITEGHPRREYRSVEDLWRMVADDPPTEENVEGFVACLTALQYDPRAFLEVAWNAGTWNAYHALHEIARLCGPAAQEFASVLLHALAQREAEEEG